MTTKRFGLIALVAALLGGIACSSSATVTLADAASPAPEAQARVAVLIDNTASTSWTRVPAVRCEEFDPLIALLVERGGELAVGLISDRSNRGLLRLAVPEPPGAPVEPNPHQNPFLLAEARAKFETQRRAHQAALAAWKSDVQRRVATFRGDLEKLLAQPADAGRTDLWEAIRRAELFLNEPQPVGRLAPQKWLLAVSDAEDNVRRPKASLSSGIRLLLINSSATLGDLAEAKPLRFESFHAATEFLLREAK